MLDILEDIFKQGTIEINASGERKRLHSHTSLEQGLFLQKVIEHVKPKQTLEIGLALGISTLFILEKLQEFNNDDKSHLIIEPFPWGGVPEYNIEKAKLSHLANYQYKKSDEVLPCLYHDKHRIQFAYVDTTKLFDIVLTDFYFIDKILDVNGIIVFDDCGGNWPGIQRVARFVNSLPNYKVYGTSGKVKTTAKRRTAEKIVQSLLSAVPFLSKFHAGYSFETDAELGLDYNCIAFVKTEEDTREWDYDKAF